MGKSLALAGGSTGLLGEEKLRMGVEEKVQLGEEDRELAVAEAAAVMPVQAV